MWYPDLFAVPVVGATAVAIAFGWFRHRERMAARMPAADADALAARLAHLEGQVARVTQAVDAVAVEVERVGEGQRFLTAQLTARPTARLATPPAERPAPAVPAALPDGLAPVRGRVVTPH